LEREEEEEEACSFLVLTSRNYCAEFRFFTSVAGIYAVGWLKNISNDYECQGSKPNGISGHFFFIAYHFFVVRYLGRLLRRLMTSGLYLLETFSVAAAVLCFALEGFFTYHYGYHSIKQIIYGAIVGMLTAAFGITLSEYWLLWVFIYIARAEEEKKQKKTA